MRGSGVLVGRQLSVHVVGRKVEPDIAVYSHIQFCLCTLKTAGTLTIVRDLKPRLFIKLPAWRQEHKVLDVIVIVVDLGS